MLAGLLRGIAAGLWLFLLLELPAVGQDNWQRVGIFLLPDTLPDTIMLVDEITEAAPVDFFRALRARPEATTLVLLSNGGSVYGGLSVALQVHERGMTTVVPQNAWCYSACAYIFLAGRTRKLDGKLGVHQISTDGDLNLAGAQTTIADILDALQTFEVDREILGLMFRTAADDIHVFSAAEVAQYGIETARAEVGDRETASAEIPITPPSPPLSHDIGTPLSPGLPENITVVAKNNVATDLGRFERLLTPQEPVALVELLRQNGLPAEMAQAINGALSSGDVFDLGIVPRDVQIIILFGPSRSTQTLIPYRLTFYEPKLDRMTQFAMVALTDKGQYVLSLAVPSDGDEISRPNANGKQDRAVNPS